MTQEQIDKSRIAIAERCGIKVILTQPRAGGPATKGFHVYQLPDYYNSLDAMHEAEKSLDPMLSEHTSMK